MSTSSLPGDYPPGYLEAYRGDTLLAVCILFILLNVFFVVIRQLSRKISRTPLGWDDYLISLALLLNLGLCATGIISVKIAYAGRHVEAVSNVPETQPAISSRVAFAFGWMYLAAVVPAKLSICWLYLRILTNRIYRILTWIVIIVLVVTWLAYAIGYLLQCRPLQFYWNKMIEGYCIDIESSYRTTGLPNILTDVAMLIIPLPTIWQLRVPRIRKVGLTFIFLTGSIGIIASCVRTSIFLQSNFTIDNTWFAVPLYSWSIIEPSMYLIATCFLSFRPIVSRATPNWLKARLFGSNENRDDAARGPQKRGFIHEKIVKGPSDPNSITQIMETAVTSEARSVSESEELDPGIPFPPPPARIMVRSDVDVRWRPRDTTDMV